MILWLTGNTGSGKTTLARKLIKANTVLLDGDEMRGVWPGLNLTPEDRREQCLRVARLAHLLETQGLTVIVAVICPFEDLRRDVERICNCIWMYLPGGKEGQEYPYEPPSNPTITVQR